MRSAVSRSGDPCNTVMFLNIGVDRFITGVGWDVTLTAFAPSWRSEITVLVTDSTGTGGFYFRPGSADPTPGGPTRYISDFAGNGADDGPEVAKLYQFATAEIRTLSDGVIRLEFFETYEGGIDFENGLWNSGRIMLQELRIPAPGVLALAGVGLLGCKRRGILVDPLLRSLIQAGRPSPPRAGREDPARGPLCPLLRE